MSQNFALDVAYNSSVSVIDATKPISMAYGFVLLGGGTGGSNQGLGEKVDQSITVGDTVIFSFFDTTTASQAALVTSIVITCQDVTNPNNPSTIDPFGWTTPGTYTLNNPSLAPNWAGGSAGCNMTGFGTSTPTFTSQRIQGQGNNKKTYDITITVNLGNGSGRVFQEDPEMDVMAGG